MYDLESVNKEIDKLIDKNISLFKDKKIQDMFMNFCKTERFKNAMSLETYRILGETQKDNAALNSLLGGVDSADYIDKLRNKTTIGLAFGASLMDTLKKLKKIRDKYVVFAVDRGVYWYESNGLCPDYYITCDAEANENWIPDNIDLTGRVLFAFIGGNNAFCAKFKRLGGEIAWWNSSDRLGTHYDLWNIFGDCKLINVSGNVGQALIVAAMSILNCKKLLLAGFDNCWSEYYYPDVKSKDVNKQNHEQAITTIKDLEATTNIGFLSYDFYMREYIRETNNGHRIINCTDGGILQLDSMDDLRNY